MPLESNPSFKKKGFAKIQKTEIIKIPNYDYEFFFIFLGNLNNPLMSNLLAIVTKS